MKKAFYLLIILTAGFCSCHKEDQKIAVTSSATITGIVGSVSPAGAVSDVFVVDAANAIRTVKPDANGTFKFSDLAPGNYNLFCIANTGYAVKTSMAVVVTSGKNTDVGTLAFSAAVGSISGLVGPKGSATLVTATNPTTKLSYTAVPDATTGAFKLENMVPGSYLVNFIAAAPSVAPADTSVTVNGNQNSDLGLVLFKTPNVTGSVSGTIVPAGSATVRIQNLANGVSYIAYPNSVTGKFTFPVLLPDTYTISYFPDNTHKSPGSSSVTLIAGQNLDLGNINIPLYLHTLSCSVNGTSFVGVTVVNCSYNSPNLSIGASNTSIDGVITSLNIKLDNVSGPGTYTVQGSSTSNIIYRKGSFGYNEWNCSAGANGTVTITSIDPVLKIITGSFSGTLTPVSNATGNVAITNGYFNMTY